METHAQYQARVARRPSPFVPRAEFERDLVVPTERYLLEARASRGIRTNEDGTCAVDGCTNLGKANGRGRRLALCTTHVRLGRAALALVAPTRHSRDGDSTTR